MINNVHWGRKGLQALLGLVLAVALSACGGGGADAGTPVVGPGSGSSSPTGGTTTATAADLVVQLSKSTMVNSGSDSITVTVTSIDANNVAVGSVPVSFSVNANAIVTPSGTTTDSKTGVLTATVTEGADTTVRAVTVTAVSGTVTRTVTFNVVQNPVTTTPTANALTISLSANNIDNSGSKTITATATAVDANRNALAGIPIQLSVADTSAFVSVPSGQTDANGQVTGTVNIGQDHSNRTVTITATSGTLTSSTAFVITGASLQGTAVPASLAAGTTGAIQYTLTDVNKNPMQGLPITVSGSGITSITGVTDSNGAYTYSYTAPNSPGSNLVVGAVAGGSTRNVTVTILGGSNGIAPVTTPVVSGTLLISPSVVSVNTASTNNQSAIGALFQAANNAAIPNIRVRFDLNGDVNSVGGTIGAGANLVYSDAGGNATSTYTPGAVGSPTNGVTIRACWDYADFAVGSCPHQILQTLTVVSNPVAISIGQNNVISSDASGLNYVKQYTVRVTDQAGNPKSGVQITPSIDLSGYYKGLYVWDPVGLIYVQNYYLNGAATPTTYVSSPVSMCTNEDINRNGLVDSVASAYKTKSSVVNGVTIWSADLANSTTTDALGNSLTENFKLSTGANIRLAPTKSDVSIAMVGSTATDVNGVAILQISYAKSFGSWEGFTITASAAGVLSAPATYSGILPVAAADLTTQTPPPAFQFGPYGQNRVPAADLWVGDSSGVIHNYCTNSN